MTEKAVSSLRARLSLEDGSDELAQQAASALKKAGFRVVHIGRFGVGFEGDSELFQQVFQSQPQTTQNGWTFQTEPRLPEEFSDLRASVYFPTKPTFFNEKTAKPASFGRKGGFP